MREGAQLEGPGTGAKSSYSQRTKFFCPIKSPPGSRQGKKPMHSSQDPSSEPHRGERGCRCGPGAGPALVTSKDLFPGI